MTAMRSLRSRLITGLILGISLFLAINGVLLYAVLEKRLYRELDRSLATILRSLAPTIHMELGRGPGREPPPRVDKVIGFQGRDDLWLQCWSPDGSTIYKSAGLDQNDLPRMSQDLEPMRLEEVLTRGLPLTTILHPRIEGRSARAVGLKLHPPPRPRERRGGPPPRRGPNPRQPPPLEVTLAQDQSELEATLAHVRWLLALAWVTSSLGCAGILVWVVHRGLRPLDALRAQIDEIDEGRLDRRFSVEGAPTELVPVIVELNGLIERIGAAFDREQQFASHAAHELRTPLAGIRSTLEVALSRPRDEGELQEALRDSLDIALRMQVVVQGLFDLAHLKASDVDAAEGIAVSELAEVCFRPLRDRARERQLTLAVDVDPEITWPKYRGLSERVVGNLLDNAVSYAEEGTDIDMFMSDGDLIVRNVARRLPPDVAKRACDAFWRADEARAKTGEHAGLGLSLCKKIVDSLGGSLELRYEDPTFEVRVRLKKS